MANTSADLISLGLPLAFASLPLNLAIQQKPGTEDYRVSTITQIEQGEIFGPIVAPSCAVSPSQPATSALGLVTAEGLNTFMFESNDKCNWMKFVRLSLNGSYNMEAIQEDGAVYFIVTKPIRPKAELKVSLSSSYAEILAKYVLTFSESVYSDATEVSLLSNKIGEEIQRCGWPNTMRALKLDHSSCSTVTKLLSRIVELPQACETTSAWNMLEIAILERFRLWWAMPDDERAAQLTNGSDSCSAISLTNSADIFVMSPWKIVCSRYSASLLGVNSAAYRPDSGTVSSKVRPNSDHAGLPEQHIEKSPEIVVVDPVELFPTPQQNLEHAEISLPSAMEQLPPATSPPDVDHVHVTSAQVFEIDGEHFCLMAVPESCELDGGHIEIEPPFEIEAVEEEAPKISEREARRLGRERTKEELRMRKEERTLAKQTALSSTRRSSRGQDSVEDDSDSEGCSDSERRPDRRTRRKFSAGRTKPQSRVLVSQRRKRSNGTEDSELHVCSWLDCLYSTRSAYDFKHHAEKHEGLSGGVNQPVSEFGPAVEPDHVEGQDIVDDHVLVNEFGPTDLSFSEPVVRSSNRKPPKKSTCAADREERIKQHKEYARLYRIRARLKKYNLPYDDEAVANYDPADLPSGRCSKRKGPPTEHTYECSICGKVLPSRIKYRQHINVIHKQSVPDPLLRVPQGVFTCDQCPHTTKTQSTLNNHKRRMHAIHSVAQLSNECAVCLMTFSNHITLGIHGKTHMNADGEYPCRFCTRSFAAHHNLKMHIARGHAEQDAAERAHRIAAEGSVAVAAVTEHQCDVCLQYYASKRRVQQHFRRVHREEFQAQLRQKFPNGDKYKCRLCQKGFCNRSALTSHITCLHTKTGKAAMACRFCEESFTGASEYYNHLQTHADASGQLQCPACAESLPVSEFSQHYRNKHQGSCTCDVCGRVLSSTTTLKDHKRQRHSAYMLRRDCPLCGKVVGRCVFMRRHLATEHPNDLVPDIEELDPLLIGLPYSEAYGGDLLTGKKQKTKRRKPQITKRKKKAFDDSSKEPSENSELYSEASSDDSD